MAFNQANHYAKFEWLALAAGRIAAEKHTLLRQ
jgi:hypothetical protein